MKSVLPLSSTAFSSSTPHAKFSRGTSPNFWPLFLGNTSSHSSHNSGDREIPAPAKHYPATMEERHSMASRPHHHRHYNHHLHRHHHHHHRRDRQIDRKRKLVIEEEETLTLRRRSIEHGSTWSRFESSQSSYRQYSSHGSDYTSRHASRKWAYSAHDCSNLRDTLVLVSYNILGVENASKHPHLYFGIPHKYLVWNHRMSLIHKELSHYDPCILCFQEVDRFNDLQNALQKDGFQGVLKSRTGDARDGCAIFWKDQRFSLVHEESIEFKSFGLRNNVAQFCVLKMNEDRLHSDHDLPKSKNNRSRSLVVGNIHVLFNPNCGDVKLGQVRLFLEKAYSLSEEWGQIPVVLAGDMNSVPQSPIYEFISSSNLNILQYDRKRMSGQIELPASWGIFPPLIRECYRQRPSIYRWNAKELELATGNEQVTCLQHHLKLYSAYFGVPGNVATRDDIGEPLATSCHSKFTGTVDYIWHTEELVPVRVLETLPINVLQEMGGLPNEKWGSDHLALVCELAFKDTESESESESNS